MSLVSAAGSVVERGIPAPPMPGYAAARAIALQIVRERVTGRGSADGATAGLSMHLMVAINR